MRIRTNTDEDPVLWTPVLTAIGSDATYWYWNLAITRLPSGDGLITLEKHEPIRLDLDIGRGDVDPEALGLSGDGLVEAVGNAFRTTPPSQFQLVFSGSSGATTTSLSGNSPLVTFAFDQGINLGTVGDGELISDDHLRIVTGPAALSWSPDAVVKTINVRGSLSFQQIGFGAVYSLPNNLGTPIINPPLYIGTTRVGNFYRRISKDADDDLAGNVRYDRATGHSNIGAASISDQVRIFKLSTGGALLPTGAAGHNYVREAAVPSADGYRNNDLLDVREGSERGHYAKKSEFETGAADTGWAGKSIDAAPRGNLQPVDVVGSDGNTYRHYRYAARAYTDPRGTAQIAAGGVSPGVAGLYYIDLSVRTPGNDMGQWDIRYDSGRTYSGNIQIRTTGAIEYDFLVRNVDTLSWRLGNIGQQSVSRMLAGQLIVTEPDHVDSVEVHSWDLIANTVSQRITQAQYTALATKEADVLYIVIG